MGAWRCWLLLLGVMLLAGPVAVSAQGVDPARTPTAQIRFVHAVSGAPAVDLYLDGQRIVAGLPPGQATAYGLAATGEQRVTVHPAGANAATAQPLLNRPVTLGQGRSYTLAMAGRAGAVESFLFEDDTGTNAEGRGSLRLVNLAPQQAALAAALDDAALTGVVPYGQASERVAVPKEVTSSVVTVIDNVGTPILETPPIPFGGGEFYTLFMMGDGVQPLLLSYPLTNGGLPPTTIWLPLSTSGGAAAPTPGAGATAVPPATTAQVLPVAGDAGQDWTLPLWLAVDGFLLMLLVVAAWWGWEQRRRA